jgi:hypothetical protein
MNECLSCFFVGSHAPRDNTEGSACAQVREHIQRTLCEEVSWKDMLTICAGIDAEHIKQMAAEYADYDIWSIEHDANGHPRLLVENMG